VPTPFMHLWMANQLHQDMALATDLRQQLKAHLPDFLLGSVVADARPDGGERADTHFYRYDRPMTAHPWRVMLAQSPSLQQPKSAEHRAFLAGYVAHLAADEYWSKHVLQVHFANGDWGGSLRWRFFVLHLLLIHLDERDEGHLPLSNREVLRQSEPDAWLPFLPDDKITSWRDFIAGQIDGDSQTLAIFGARVQRTPEELHALVHDAQTMQRYLWDHVTPQVMQQHESAMLAFSRQQLTVYLQETPLPEHS
jgi:hypothetical protein